MASIAVDFSMKLLEKLLNEVKIKTVAEGELMNSLTKCIKIIVNYESLWENRQSSETVKR